MHANYELNRQAPLLSLKLMYVAPLTSNVFHEALTDRHQQQRLAQGCHQLNLSAVKVNGEMALNLRYEDQRECRNDKNHSNHLFLHVELQ